MLCPKCGSYLGPTTGMPTEQIYCVKCKKWVPTNTKPRSVSEKDTEKKGTLVFTPEVSAYTDPVSTDL